MIEVDTSKLLALPGSSSKGDQHKWCTYDRKYFYKGSLFRSVEWKDYLVEVIGTKLCQKLFGEDVRYAIYSKCSILGYGLGCASPTFLQSREAIVTFAKYAETHRIELPPEVAEIDEVYHWLVDILEDVGYSQPEDYLAQLFIVDYILANRDRHLNNIALLYNQGKYSPAPLFDFGVGMYQGYVPSLTYGHKQCVQWLKCKPYGRSFDEVLDFYLRRGYIQKYIPKSLDVTGWEFPSQKGAMLFANQCKRLGVPFRGLTKEDVLCLTLN